MMWRDTVRQLLLETGAFVYADEIKSFSDGRGYPWSMPELTHEEFFEGRGWWENTEIFIYENLLEMVGAERAEYAARHYRERYLDLKYWGVFPDTVPVLKSLRDKGYMLYILSNHVPEARDLIHSLKIDVYFEKMYLSAEIGAEKPHPLIYKRALQGKEGDINIMVGDNYEADIEGALKNGFRGAIMVRKPRENEYPYYSRYLTGVEPLIGDIICALTNS